MAKIAIVALILCSEIAEEHNEEIEKDIRFALEKSLADPEALPWVNRVEKVFVGDAP